MTNKRDRRLTLLEKTYIAMKIAKNTIKEWHGEVGWAQYQHSPEMELLNASIYTLRKEINEGEILKDD